MIMCWNVFFLSDLCDVAFWSQCVTLVTGCTESTAYDKERKFFIFVSFLHRVFNTVMCIYVRTYAKFVVLTIDIH